MLLIKHSFKIIQRWLSSFFSKENAVATKLIAERIKLTKSIEEVAAMLNVAAETIVQIENGDFNNVKALEQLVALYGVKSADIDFFLNSG